MNSKEQFNDKLLEEYLSLTDPIVIGNNEIKERKNTKKEKERIQILKKYLIKIGLLERCIVCAGAESARTEQEYNDLCTEHKEANERNLALIDKARYEAEHDL